MYVSLYKYLCLFMSSVPSAPLDLRVTCTGPTSINITWSAPANANGILLRYYVYFIISGVVGKEVVLTKHNVTADPKMMSNSISFTNVVPNTIYFIDVSAETRIGEGASTDSYYFVMNHDTDFNSLIFVKTVNSTSINLSWNNSEYGSGDDIDSMSNSTVGLIIYHNVTGEEQLNVDLSVINNTAGQLHVFQGLMPFTYYEFSVSGYLIEEGFTYCTKSSDSVVARTDEDCKILHIKICALD